MKYIGIMITLLAGACFGASTSDIGTDAGVFLRMGAGARAAGMGDTYSAVCDDASAVYWNPAALNKAGSFGLMLMDAMWFENVSYEWGAINFSTEAGKFGVGIQYVSYGAITETDATGLDYGSLSPTDLAASLSYANKFMGFDLGVTAKYISMALQSAATGFTFDVGIEKMLELSSDLKINVALVGDNIFGQTINFGDMNEPLTAYYKLGVAVTLSKDLLVTAEASMPSDNAMYYSAGAEYTVNLTGDLKGKVRCGYNTMSTLTGGLNGLTLGMGLGSSEYSVDYAFVPNGNLGYTNIVSFTVAFGRGKEKEKEQEPAKKYTMHKTFSVTPNSGNNVIKPFNAN